MLQKHSSRKLETVRRSGVVSSRRLLKRMEKANVGPPRSFPIKSLEQLRNRSYFDSVHFRFNKSSVPLQNGGTSREKRPRLLACHDLKGGYLDDQWIQGSQNADAYTLSHWRLLDSFVYFSHNLVTLPPPGWTNAAHRHGVQVLGTFITEWSEGAKVCQELLASEESARMYADRLAELAEALGFDGWLINIENKIAHAQCPNLQEFVHRLNSSMHSLVPESLVIWYDSVTVKGKLHWQDCLNGNNKPFFDLCDGIFINYTWKKDYPKQSAIAAGDRKYDVYMGVDVFGRNTFGGGGFQCDVALKVAREAGVSAALFAPGWTYETNQDPCRWWDSIENCWPVARADPVQLPFFTDFDIGRGIAKCLEGTQVLDLPWSNLSCQSLQPLLHVAELNQGQIMVSISEENTVYGGGVCVKAVGDVGHDEVCILWLYHPDISIQEASLGVSYSIKAESDSNFCLAICLQDNMGAKVVYFLLDTDEADTHSIVKSHQFTHISAVFERSKRLDSTTGSRHGSNIEITEALARDLVVSSGKLWTVRSFTLEWGNFTLLDVFGICSAAKDMQPILMKLIRENEALFDGETFVKQKRRWQQTESGRPESSMLGLEESNLSKDNNVPYCVRLGHISIASASHEHSRSTDPEFIGHHPSWWVGDGGNKFVSVNLSWKLPNNKAASWIPEWYHLDVTLGFLEEDKMGTIIRYLGMTMLGFFYIYMLPVQNLSQTLTFRLRRQCSCGKVQTQSHKDTYILQVPPLESGNYERTQPVLCDWLFK